MDNITGEALGVDNVIFPKQKDPVGRLARKYPYRRSYPQKTRIRYGS
jgi:hypothetical protein